MKSTYCRYVIRFPMFSVITRRQIELSDREIRDAIDQCDVKQLPGEKAEFLLAYVPTKEEVGRLLTT